MTTATLCLCKEPTPRSGWPDVCDECGGKIRQKEDESRANRATMPAEFHRELNNLRQEFNKKLDALKAKYLNQ